jgi:hypothetical protein
MGFGGPGGGGPGGGGAQGGPPSMQGGSSSSGSSSGSAQGGFPGAPPTGTQTGSGSSSGTQSGFPGAPPTGTQGGSASGGSSSGTQGSTSGGSASGSAQSGPGGGGMFVGNNSDVTQALTYVSKHGGGTIAVSSQSGAASQIITSGAKVAGIGGFSGRESEVSIQWLAQQVAAGKIRWILVEGSGGGMQDGRVGSSQVMAAVAKVGKQVSYGGSGTLYDVQGQASALLSAITEG